MAPIVVIRRSLLQASLHVWGRAEDGWWGGLTWHQRIAADGVESELPFAAWVPAAELKPDFRYATDDVQRVELPADPRAWPLPRTWWPCWFVGRWTDGPPIAPAGLELVEGATWRKGAKRG